MAETILWPAVKDLLAGNPDLFIEISIDGHLTDIITARFDAGIRLGEQIAKDMIAVRIGPELRMAVVEAPHHFALHGRPQTPYDLTKYACINIRMQTKGSLYAWEFGHNGHNLNVRVEGPLIINDVSLIPNAAREGTGLACVMEDHVDALIREGSLERVLDD